MWQFQWAISLIPDAMLNWIYWSIIAVGITGVLAGWVGKFIPFYGNYAKILQPIGIILLVLGVWLRGGYDVEMAWRDKVSKLEVPFAVSLLTDISSLEMIAVGAIPTYTFLIADPTFPSPSVASYFKS